MSTLTAGFVISLVGVTSSIAIVFQAARNLGANEAQVASWLFAAAFLSGALSAGLSLRYRMPIMIAWSTPGAAVIASTPASGRHSLATATGAFIIVGIVSAVIGFSGAFTALVERIPPALASALLAGVLAHFALDAFAGATAQPAIVVSMFAAYLVGRRLLPRYVMLIVLVTGALAAALAGEFAADTVTFGLAHPQWVTPRFGLAELVSIGLPLFIVTMAGQNLPGVATIRTYEYPVPVNRVIGICGLGSIIGAPFGGYAVNLAAITAAMGMGPSAHEDRSRRYTAAVIAGFFYIAIAILGTTLTSLLLAVPAELVQALAGLALIATIVSSLRTAVTAGDRERDAAVITFLVVLSGVRLLGIGAPFWGAVAGVVAFAVLPRPRMA